MQRAQLLSHIPRAEDRRRRQRKLVCQTLTAEAQGRARVALTQCRFRSLCRLPSGASHLATMVTDSWSPERRVKLDTLLGFSSYIRKLRCFFFTWRGDPYSECRNVFKKKKNFSINKSLKGKIQKEIADTNNVFCFHRNFHHKGKVRVIMTFDQRVSTRESFVPQGTFGDI